METHVRSRTLMLAEALAGLHGQGDNGASFVEERSGNARPRWSKAERKRSIDRELSAVASGVAPLSKPRKRKRRGKKKGTA
jgi:hypothetical protein